MCSEQIVETITRYPVHCIDGENSWCFTELVLLQVDADSEEGSVFGRSLHVLVGHPDT